MIRLVDVEEEAVDVSITKGGEEAPMTGRGKEREESSDRHPGSVDGYERERGHKEGLAEQKRGKRHKHTKGTEVLNPLQL